MSEMGDLLNALCHIFWTVYVFVSLWEIKRMLRENGKGKGVSK